MALPSCDVMLDSVPFAAAVLAHDISAAAGDHAGGGRDQGEEHCDENTGRCPSWTL